MAERIFYYWGDGKKVYLEPSEDTLVIAYKEQVPDKDFVKLVLGDEELTRFAATPELEKRRLVLYKRRPNASTPLAALAARLARSDRIAYVCPLYYQEGQPVIVSDEFIAAFKAHLSRQAIDELNAANDVEIVEDLGFAPNTFLLQVRSPQDRGALDAAVRYFETGLVDYAEPNLIHLITFDFTPNDPLYGQQWHLPRIQADTAWDITRGATAITVAVIDDGVETGHEDFSSAGKIIPGRDVVSGDNDPNPALSTDNHGTQVAGVAVAEGNNSRGVCGVAPNCSLMGIRYVGAMSESAQASAFRFAADHGAAVINNSYSRKGTIPSAIVAAINYAVTSGRLSSGCVVLFSTGNDNLTVTAGNSYATIANIIAVAACNDNNVRSSYSNYGPEVSVCAPSDDGSGHARIVTTDRTGNAGANPPSAGSDPISDVNYSGTFGGTSAACPEAAGVAALALSVNPDLTRQQVRYILEATADKIDAANTDSTGRYGPDGHSDWYGYGRVNAFEVVKGARSSVPDRDFTQRITVTLRRVGRDRFASVKPIHAIDARQRRAETPTDAFVRGGPDGFLRTQLVIGPLTVFDEVEVDQR